MQGFIKEFKAFAVRGNVMDLAIAVIIGTAFGKIVSSLVDTIIMPFIGMFLGGVNFSGLSFSFGMTMVKYGVFFQSIVDFVIIAFVIFLVVKGMNRFKKHGESEVVTEKLKEPSPELQVLTEIRDLLSKER